MSTDQPAAQDFRKPRWKVDGVARRCLGCGSHVLPGLQRTHGDRDDNLHACPKCPGVTMEDLKHGAGADPDYERRAGSSTR